MENPVLVEVLRGQTVESRHRGAIAIVDAAGNMLASVGEIDAPIFPRSAIKPLQALYLTGSGALEAYDLDDKDLALACSSHNGEDVHTHGVVTMLDKAGLSETCLECGAQWPKFTADKGKIMGAGEKPKPVHNNCSGKHSGFIVAANYLGEKVEGYVRPDHAVQREIKAILAELYGYEIKQETLIATDGCSIPTYAVPLRKMAHGLARFAAASDLGQARDRQAKAIHNACVAEPLMVAGTRRFDTDIMADFGDKVLVKTGAEGVYAGHIPSLGVGIALKCEDGGTRASEAMMAACLASLMEEKSASVEKYLHVGLKNWNGMDVGAVRVADGVIDGLKARIT